MPKQHDIYKTIRKTPNLPFSSKYIRVIQAGPKDSIITIYDTNGQCAENVSYPNSLIDDKTLFELDTSVLFLPLTIVLDAKKKELSVSTKTYLSKADAKKDFGDGYFCWGPKVMSDGTMQCNDSAFVKNCKTVLGL